MHAHSNSEIKISSSKETIKKAFDYIVSKIPEAVLNDNLNINIEETYDCVFLEDIIGFSKELNRLLEGVCFEINGVIDTSETAGEY